MKKCYFFILAAFGFLFFACGETKTNQSTQTLSADSTQTPPQSTTVLSAENMAAPRWHFVSKPDQYENPQTSIFLVQRDTTLVYKMTAAMNVIEKKDFAAENIPKNAVIAANGYWAGLGARFIVVDSSNFWVVKAIYFGEDAAENEVFETVKSVKKQ